MAVYTRIKLSQYHVPEAATFKLLEGGDNDKVKKECDILFEIVIFGVMVLCSVGDCYHHFGGTWCLHLQEWKSK
jgi:hypothetical protein